MAYEVTGACVPIEVLVMGLLENNVYIIGGDEVFVVDPSCDAPRIVKALGGRVPAAIVLTHDHWDHVGAACALREATGAPVVASSIDAQTISGARSVHPSHTAFEPCPVDRVVADGEVLEIGSMKWRVVATPGHTPGSMCLFLDPRHGLDPTGAPVLVSGDTLFAGTHGRTDFEGGDPADMRRSLARLADLPDDTIVLPGHNTLTTIARERVWLPHG